jgi:hypothetical protein
MGVHDSLQDEGKGLYYGTCTLGCVWSSLDFYGCAATAEPNTTHAEMRNSRKIFRRPGSSQPTVVRRLHGCSEH